MLTTGNILVKNGVAGHSLDNNIINPHLITDTGRIVSLIQPGTDHLERRGRIVAGGEVIFILPPAGTVGSRIIHAPQTRIVIAVSNGVIIRHLDVEALRNGLDSKADDVFGIGLYRKALAQHAAPAAVAFSNQTVCALIGGLAGDGGVLPGLPIRQGSGLQIAVENQVVPCGCIRLLGGIALFFNHNQIIYPQIHSGVLVLEFEHNTTAVSGMIAHVGLDGILCPFRLGGKMLRIIGAPAGVLDGDAHRIGHGRLCFKGDDKGGVFIHTGDVHLDGAPATSSRPLQAIAAIGAFCHHTATAEGVSTVVEIHINNGRLFCENSKSTHGQNHTQHSQARAYGHHFS